MPAPDESVTPSLEVEELSLDGGVRVIALAGELDVSTVEQFEPALQSAVDAGTPAVIADLTRLTFLDSTGLAAMLRAVRSLGLAGHRLLVACANPTVLRLFEITGTIDTFDITPTRELAIDRALRPEGAAR